MSNNEENMGYAGSSIPFNPTWKEEGCNSALPPWESRSGAKRTQADHVADLERRVRELSSEVLRRDLILNRVCRRVVLTDIVEPFVKYEGTECDLGCVFLHDHGSACRLFLRDLARSDGRTNPTRCFYCSEIFRKEEGTVDYD